MKFKLFIFLLCFVGWTNVGAQTFKWQSELEKVQTNGFYKVALTPQMVATTENTALADLRIFEKNKEIAYLIRRTPDSVYRKDTTALRLQNYTAVPSASITVKEDKANQRTIVSITFNENYQIDKLVLKLEGFRYYKRMAWLTETDPLIKNKKNRYSEYPIEEFSISSEKPAIIDLYSENRYKKLFLIINNEDNSPLSVKNIIAYQKNIELIAYLEKNKQYIMKTGQLNVQTPKYDLSYFSDSISNTVPFIKAADFKIHNDKVLRKEATFIKKGWMWAALGSLILFLGYLSYYMVRDMQRKK